jgi:hypothetical protein
MWERFYQIVLDAKPAHKYFRTDSPVPVTTQWVDSERAITRPVSKNRGGHCLIVTFHAPTHP